MNMAGSGANPESVKKGDAAFTTMHVKYLVAGERLMLIGSANLTNRAMTRNMELGIWVEGGEEPHYIATHFNRLIRQKALTPNPLV